MRVLAAIAVVLLAGNAYARPSRPRFEPTDLELEVPGTLDLDLQVGYIDSTPTSRLIVPDFEVDLGITRRFELDLDGTFAIDSSTSHTFQPDNLWLSGKVGVLDVVLPSKLTVAAGFQVGPRFGVSPGSRGFGGEGLLLLGLTYRRVQVTLNAGGYWDPSRLQNDGTRPRPRGLQLGGSVDVDLTHDGRWSFHVEVGGTVALAVDPSQVVVAAGIVLSPSKALDVSLLGLVGLLPGSDRAGALFGASPRVALWR